MLKVAPLAVISFCVLSACSHTATADKDGASMHVVARDGTAVNINEKGTAIADYPSDVPIYEGKAVVDAKTDRDHTRTVIMQVGDSPEKVTNFYKGKLEGQGWKLESSVSAPQAAIYKATKGDRKLVITIAPGDSGQTSVTQVLSDK